MSVQRLGSAFSPFYLINSSVLLIISSNTFFSFLVIFQIFSRLWNVFSIITFLAWRNRLAIFPQTLVIDVEENNTITWVNQGILTAKITDRERGLWSIDKIKPSAKKSIQLNSTGFYSFLVVVDVEGEIGRIVP